jgi:DNA-binding MarR family transcriptional regulator
MKIVWTTVVRKINNTFMTVPHPHQASTDRSFDSLEQEVFLNLWRTYDRLRILEEELFVQYDLTPQQYNALRLLCAEHPSKVRTLDLAGRLVSRAPDITRLLDKLEQRGLIERDRPADNRRVVHVGITEAGRDLLRRLREPIRRCHVGQLGHLSEKELRDLTTLLRAARQPHEDPSGRWR